MQTKFASSLLPCFHSPFTSHTPYKIYPCKFSCYTFKYGHLNVSRQCTAKIWTSLHTKHQFLILSHALLHDCEANQLYKRDQG
mmetsp:Transcript_6483/g.11613  ORF Transcript_6483/g.11613 Transcript_6483/m.11613 type:complete len:83 (-) Transcript_6483:675-923(-)